MRRWEARPRPAHLALWRVSWRQRDLPSVYNSPSWTWLVHANVLFNIVSKHGLFVESHSGQKANRTRESNRKSPRALRQLDQPRTLADIYSTPSKLYFGLKLTRKDEQIICLYLQTDTTGFHTFITLQKLWITIWKSPDDPWTLFNSCVQAWC